MTKYWLINFKFLFEWNSFLMTLEVKEHGRLNSTEI